MKLIFFWMLLFVCSSAYSQRYIKLKANSTYLVDTSGNLITGTLTQMRSYIAANMAVEDTANFTIASTLSSAREQMRYKQEDDISIADIAQSLIVIRKLTTDRIIKLQALIPDELKNRVLYVWDRTRNLPCFFDKTNIVYLQTIP